MLGVQPGQVYDALGTYIGSTYVNDFNFMGRTYRVTAQADGAFRQDVRDITIALPEGEWLIEMAIDAPSRRWGRAPNPVRIEKGVPPPRVEVIVPLPTKKPGRSGS